MRPFSDRYLQNALPERSGFQDFKEERGIMSSFLEFAAAVRVQFQNMIELNHTLVYMDVGGDSLWETYLGSFPPGSNPLYNKNTDHDCRACRHFIRNVGNVASIDQRTFELMSIWDVSVEGPYQAVADALAAQVKSAPVKNLFFTPESRAGSLKNHMKLESGEVVTWDHFFLEIPLRLVNANPGPANAKAKSNYDVFLRGLKEITPGSIDVVLDLIAQDSIYRGADHKGLLLTFKMLQERFLRLGQQAPEKQLLFCWASSPSTSPALLIRNTVIGTLLTDLSEGVELERAVASFESKMAPTNYKRPTALVTPAMVQRAQDKIMELGLAPALERRFAAIEDIRINDILFADRSARKAMNVFDDLARRAVEKLPNLNKVEDVPIEKFLTDVLPQAESLEVFVENKHAGNFVSLIAPVDPEAKPLFKWSNNFSWSYAGDLADSIKERVKRAGGNVTGDLRCSLSWFNYDDLDLHMQDPGGAHIFYGDKRPFHTTGVLDVDMNAGSGKTRNAVENIVYPRRTLMKEGVYTLYVRNFHARETVDVGFEVEIEFEGTVHSFSYSKAVRQNENVIVAKFRYTHAKGIEFIESLEFTQASKTLWQVPTQAFHPVNVVMLSPNYWTDQIGNKHYFFMLNDCRHEGQARGFFNEFLSQELNEHRKVIEMVGARMTTEKSDRQLSGLGFSSTQRNHLLCRVKGSFTRTVRIVF